VAVAQRLGGELDDREQVGPADGVVLGDQVVLGAVGVVGF
jgi:hypothetical protein